MTSGTGMSIRAYARHRGVSHVAVQKAIKAGRIALEPDGGINPVKADAGWARNTDPVRAAGTPTAPVAPTATPVTAPNRLMSPEPAPAPTGGSLSFAQARTSHEVTKASLARLRLQERRGELVDRRRAVALVFRLAREERDAWVTWPARVAALMAAELGIDPHSLQKVLETHVRAQLADLAEIAPDLR
jgi:hypothetical protein